jgi:L-fucose isomerase-like protein
MSRMSELDIELRERVAQGQSPSEVAQALGIPKHWVTEMTEENEYQDYMAQRASDEFFAEQAADADALNYGTR